MPPITAQVAQQGSVLYARVVNNTIVGRGGDAFGNGVGDVGIVIEDNASPTLLNNVIANFDVGIRSDLSANDSNALRRTFVGNPEAIDQFAFNTLDVVAADGVTNFQIAGFGTLYTGLFDPGNDFRDSPLYHRDVENSGTIFVGERPTIIGSTVFQNNNDNSFNISVGDDAIELNPDDPLFVDGAAGNYFLAANSQAIDSSLDFLAERDYLSQVMLGAGITPKAIETPDIDSIGITRVDDPSFEPANGQGSNVFKDRGALERGDFVGPTAALLAPQDNGDTDQDPQLDSVAVFGEAVTRFELQLRDGVTISNPVFGSGIDDLTVESDAIIVRRNATALTEGVDYTLTYDVTNNTLRIIPAAGVWTDGSYEIELLNSEAGAAFIRDRGDNPIQANQPDGRTVYTVQLGTGLDFGDAPSPFPTLLADDGARHVVDENVFLGAGLSLEGEGKPTTEDTLDDGVNIGPLFLDSQVNVTVTASTFGFVNAWLDIDGNGSWDDPGNQIFTNQTVNAGANSLSFFLPSTASTDTMYARFRFSTVAGGSFTGEAPDGEVEDYAVQVTTNPWQNPNDPLNVDDDADGFVAPNDALAIINELNDRMVSDPTTGQLPIPAPSTIQYFYDVNGDGFVSPVDAIRVINALSSNVTAQAPLSSGSVDRLEGDNSLLNNNPLALTIGSHDEDNDEASSTTARQWDIEDVLNDVAADVAARWYA